MKNWYISVLLAWAFCSATQAQNFNMVMRDSLAYTDRTSNIGGIAINGYEFALVGWGGGLSIVDVTDPDSIFEVINIPGIQSNWREVKTFGNYAYVTNEGGGGLQIIDCSNLPASAPYTTYVGDGAITGQLNTIHALHIDAGYLYLYGCSFWGGTAIICNLNNNPLAPEYMGHTPTNYVHDGYVRNDTLYACEIYNGLLAVYDVTNKANPTLINSVTTPNAFTHNSWLNDAGTVVFTTDETANSFLTAYDITDITNITELDRIQTAPGSNSIVHNTHTLNDYEIVSWYTEGVVIVDASKPTNLVEVAKFDMSPFSGGTFNGAWGVYPYLPSGNLVVSDIEGGLYVLTPTYKRACFLEGLVTDSTTGLPINAATIKVLPINIQSASNFLGNYSMGVADSGTYDIEVSAFGYQTKTYTGISLTNGNTTILNAEINKVPTISVSGNITNAGNGLPVPNAKVRIKNSFLSLDTVADANGNFSVSSIIPGNYDVVAQQWGFHTDCINMNLAAGSSIALVLPEGIYDDFTFDWGWTVTGNATMGMFVRDVPLGTSTSGITINPAEDDLTDCGDMCYVTGNTGVQFFDDYLADGYTQLESPVFDATVMLNPRVTYKRWFFNYGDPSTGAVADDTLIVSISNGTQTAVLEAHHPGNTFASWFFKSFKLSNYVPLTSTMKLIVYTSNQPFSPDVLEVGFDKFSIVQGLAGVDDVADAAFQIFPNPAQSSITLVSDKPMQQVEIFDLTGRILQTEKQVFAPQVISLSNLESGTYIVRTTFSDGHTAQQKLIKQ
ncbi:MAG: choice-of-anchor B family protein [Bacteroidia bacterium]|nr:choice-of-anchor B family protein [Bacteroidia bacterium]